MFLSHISHVTDKMKRVVISLDKALALRGDILVKCYHKKVRPPARTSVFRTQFHTCAINDETLSFSKAELDGAYDGNDFLSTQSIIAGPKPNLLFYLGNAIRLTFQF